MPSALEQTRLLISKSTDANRKSHFGQFLTPATTARFMAGLFSPSTGGVCRLLDPGAGIGSLTSAFLDRCLCGTLTFDKLEIAAFELDGLLHGALRNTLAGYAGRLPLAHRLFGGDFVEQAVNKLQFDHTDRFSHAIINPPYKKINSKSNYRLLLRQANIETVNLYSAFVALALSLMAPRGEVVAIIPRSFCNGPYYRPFRDFLFAHAAIRHIHLFESRNTAFKDDGVLQENLIILLECAGTQGDVVISTSRDDSFADLATRTHPFQHIVVPGDPERFIHIPTSLESSSLESAGSVRYSLADIGVQVSTGPVVDFRLKPHLRELPGTGTVPLLYPGHFSAQGTQWPKAGIDKPNAIHRNTETQRWLYPNGFYCVVRRFSTKEERRRVVASVVQPDAFGGAERIGFENHLNVFHDHKHGLPEALARGLTAYLNTSAVDEFFRRFNGHTQVNATDLRQLKYPSRDMLIDLGVRVHGHRFLGPYPAHQPLAPVP